MLKGDQHLSLNDRRTWELCYHLMNKYECPVWFKHYPPDSTIQRDEFIVWFVTEEKLKKVEFFLAAEYAGQVKKGKWIDFNGEKIWSWGFNYSVFPFTPDMHYITRNAMKAIVARNKFYLLKQLKVKPHLQDYWIFCNYSLDYIFIFLIILFVILILVLCF